MKEAVQAKPRCVKRVTRETTGVKEDKFAANNEDYQISALIVQLMRAYRTIAGSLAKDSSSIKRENANVNGDTAMGKMLQFGQQGSKAYARACLLRPAHAHAHDDGDIHIHDLDFYATGTLTCCQTDPLVLFDHGGFSTGHGYLRTPNSIGSYAALCAIILQSNQNEQHGGQALSLIHI